MKTNTNRSGTCVCLLYGIAALFAVIMVSGCAGVTIRPQPDGGDVINLFQLTQAEKFNRLEQSFHEQIARAERIVPGSEKVRKLKSEYQKIKRLWELHLEEIVEKLPDTFVNSIGITMKLIKPGTFTMGSLTSGGYADEYPAHKVTITKPFYIGVYEITGRQYSQIMGGTDTPSPKTRVSWNEAMAFCKRLSEKEGTTYTLPTEAQWEYACRAGTTTKYSFGNQWTNAASLRPNPWGIYDMHGNVWEWCQDWYGGYTSGHIVDPKGPSSGSDRVLRGGSWDDNAGGLRSAYRRRGDPDNGSHDYGFRVACCVVRAYESLALLPLYTLQRSAVADRSTTISQVAGWIKQNESTGSAGWFVNQE